LIPVGIISVIFGFVFYKLPGISGPPTAHAANPLEVKLDAHQFYWQFTYPNGAVSIDELHLPVGRVVKIDINSEDVNHSWWIPQLGGKTDAIPGRTNHIWYQPDKIGTYHGQCAEFCGLFHERMLARAIVTSEAEYESFVRSRAAKELGKAEWEGVCAKCHGPQGEGDYGPAIAANPTLVQPSGLENIVRNGRGLMPAVGNNWTQEQFRALEAYIKASVYKGASTSGG
jgi:cytochrome c oxidase subunit 2